MIDNFGVSNLFGRDNYEYYARITGRILKVEEDWIFSFRYPPDTLVSSKRLCASTFICDILIAQVRSECMNFRTAFTGGWKVMVAIRVRKMGIEI